MFESKWISKNNHPNHQHPNNPNPQHNQNNLPQKDSLNNPQPKTLKKSPLKTRHKNPSPPNKLQQNPPELPPRIYLKLNFLLSKFKFFKLYFPVIFFCSPSKNPRCQALGRGVNQRIFRINLKERPEGGERGMPLRIMRIFRINQRRDFRWKIRSLESILVGLVIDRPSSTTIPPNNATGSSSN